MLIAIILINTIYWISLITQLGRLKIWNSSFLSGLYRFSGEHGDYAVKNIIDLLAIKDAVLIAISFMIILLYKKEVKNEIL